MFILLCKNAPGVESFVSFRNLENRQVRVEGYMYALDQQFSKIKGFGFHS
jgi:hypothetical protein